MTIRVARDPDPPYRGQPGRCPPCGADVRPRPEEVAPVGRWSGRDGATGRRTGGTIFGVNCPGCGVVLKHFGRGAWEAADAALVVWHTDGERVLVGGDRWHGRPFAWSADDAVRHEAQLRELRERLGSLEEAVRTLHLTAGLGALLISGLVERVASLPPLEAKRLVVRALAPDWWGEDAEPDAAPDRGGG